MSRGYAGISWRALRLARQEPDQVRRLQAFRVAHPEVIIGDGGFGVWQARVPEPDGERTISHYTLRELLDKLNDLIGERHSWLDSGQDCRGSSPPARYLGLVAATCSGCACSSDRSLGLSAWDTPGCWC